MTLPSALSDIQQNLPTIENYSDIYDGVNDSYIVDTVEGKRFVKFGTNPTARIPTEIWVMKTLDGIVSVPHIYAYGSTSNGVPYFVSEVLTGTQGPYPTELTDTHRHIPFELGTYLATIHQQQNRTVPMGSIVDEENNTWSDFYRGWVRSRAEDAKKNYPELSSQVIRLIYWTDIPEPDKFVISPIDFHSRNVFYDNKTVTGLIDLERSYGGHPAWSYLTCVEFMEHAQIPNAVELFEKGYKSVKDLPELYPCYKLGAIVRIMRAAHMIWDEYTEKEEYLKNKVDDIESDLSHK